MKNGTVIRDLGGEHIAQSYGRCVVCHCVTWGFQGEPCPDWRGPFGNRTHSALIAEDYDMQGPDVNVCAYCENTGERYRAALEIAKAQWKEAK